MRQPVGLEVRALIRAAKRSAKAVLRPLSQRPITRARLISDIRRLGVRPGALLLVHSSLSSLGYVPGGPETVIRALIDVVGPTGTLVLPTHSWEEMEVFACRTFDVRQTRVCVGAIPEFFRSRPGVVRSLHPTHSVAAIGPLASWLTSDHELSETPCGPGSPYVKILERDGQILLLGATLNSNTVFHTIEALAGVPYLLYDEPNRFTLIAQDGTSRGLTLYRHRPGIRRRLGELEDWLFEREIVRTGQVGPARSLLLAGPRFRDALIEQLRNDPTFLLASSVDRANDGKEKPE
jgi:aminoglycoside 3-N-acetyltransferase